MCFYFSPVTIQYATNCYNYHCRHVDVQSSAGDEHPFCQNRARRPQHCGFDLHRHRCELRFWAQPDTSVQHARLAGVHRPAPLLPTGGCSQLTLNMSWFNAVSTSYDVDTALNQIIFAVYLVLSASSDTWLTYHIICKNRTKVIVLCHGMLITWTNIFKYET